MVTHDWGRGPAFSAVWLSEGHGLSKDGKYVMRSLKFIASALRQMLRLERKATDLPPRPAFRGGELVAIANRHELYGAMDGF